MNWLRAQQRIVVLAGIRGLIVFIFPDLARVLGFVFKEGGGQYQGVFVAAAAISRFTSATSASGSNNRGRQYRFSNL